VTTWNEPGAEDEAPAQHTEETPSAPSAPSALSALASETLPDDTELDWGTWGKRWRGGWDDEAPQVADLEEVAASGAETDEGWVGGVAWFGLSLDQVAGDCRGEYVPLHLHASAGGLGGGGQVVQTETESEGVGKMRRGEVEWERCAVGGGGGHTLASVIKCWVLACRQTMS
jgi:hypothetical protein